MVESSPNEGKRKSSLVATDRPNVARVYDYFLGGKDNFAVDREAAREVLEICPEVPLIALENRRFLGRTVGYLVEQGVRQFIDLGTGLPNEGHVHQVLARLDVADECRVVYVDEDPVVRAHANAYFASSPNTVLIAEDLRHPDRVLGHPRTRELIDFTKPVALLAFAILHFVGDAYDPIEVVGGYMDAFASRSWMAWSHITDEDAGVAEALDRVYVRSNYPGFPRSVDEIQTLATANGLRPVEPGVVHITDWKPSGEPRHLPSPIWVAGGVACKRA